MGILCGPRSIGLDSFDNTTEVGFGWGLGLLILLVVYTTISFNVGHFKFTSAIKYSILIYIRNFANRMSLKLIFDLIS